MSESEQMGRCRMEITAAYERTRWTVPNDSDLLIADAIDRLAADVAAVMEMTREIALRVPSELGQDACDVAVMVALKERDAAVRERDEARALLGLAQVQRNAAYADRDEAWAEVERLKAELAARPADGNRQATLGSSPAAPQPAGQGISPGLPETQSAGNAAPAPGWLTDEERRALSRAFDLLCDDDGDNPLAGTVQALLARAGSPPVVEVPPMQSWEYTAHEEALAYRAALDKAGVQWKEVGRE